MRIRTHYGMGGIPAPRYDTVLRSLHWLMAVLLITSITLVELKGILPKGHLKYEVGYMHIEIGLLILLMVCVRIFWRAMTHVPQITPSPGHLQNALAGLMHVLLYALMAILPVIGILALQAKGKNVEFFSVMLPAIVNEDTWLPYALSLRDYHELLGNIIIGAITIHVAATIFHHAFKKDNTLKRMLPMLY